MRGVSPKTLAELSKASAELRRAARGLVSDPRCAAVLRRLPDHGAVEIVEMAVRSADA